VRGKKEVREIGEGRNKEERGTERKKRGKKKELREKRKN